MIARYDVITASITQSDTHFVEQAVFGTTNPQKIAILIDSFCQKELGARVSEYQFYESSVGAVCGVKLVDGRHVVVKVHQSSRSMDFLEAVVHVQRYLLSKGYPSTKPLLDPRPIALGIATTEEFVDEGVYHQASDPTIRRSMTEMFAWLIHLTRKPEAIPVMQLASLDLRLPADVICRHHIANFSTLRQLPKELNGLMKSRERRRRSNYMARVNWSLAITIGVSNTFAL